MNKEITLRDYFAAKAMNGIISGADINMEAGDLARQAYIVADAMILKRNET